MATRPRSTSRGRVVKLSATVPSGEVLDPSALLADVISQLSSTDVNLAVKLTDGTNSVAYGLQKFLSKDYEVVGDTVKFGMRSLSLRTLRASVVFDITIVDDLPV